MNKKSMFKKRFTVTVFLLSCKILVKKFVEFHRIIPEFNKFTNYPKIFLK